ncbi:hypothetical protein ZHAS_00006126 [Anopheles sinensis]|uniref:Uncharacterized protein n=1 Tax=Anopheles sinensis TaxID=74873 RepID=A0A084VL84_ANOSI|nr:hypothetical protein ZHAS_00006126 [Anopheles sinensis]
MGCVTRDIVDSARTYAPRGTMCAFARSCHQPMHVSRQYSLTKPGDRSPRNEVSTTIRFRLWKSVLKPPCVVAAMCMRSSSTHWNCTA